MNNCACVCIELDYDTMPDFAREETRRARKTHICTECSREILLGEKYEYVCGLWDGGFETYKTCSDCLSIRNTMFCGEWHYGSLLNDLKEHVWEMQGEMSEDCLADLAPKAREIVCGMIEEVWINQEDNA